jgi:phosphate uptake regulator
MYLELLSKLVNDPSASSKCVAQGLLVTRYLERIADHAVYVCESIFYTVTCEKTSLG